MAELSKNIDQMFKQTQCIVNENTTNNKRSYCALYDYENLNYKSEPSGSRVPGFCRLLANIWSQTRNG